MAEKSVIASISQAEERHFKTLQLPALRAVVSEPAPQKRRFFLLLFRSSLGSGPRASEPSSTKARTAAQIRPTPAGRGRDSATPVIGAHSPSQGQTGAVFPLSALRPAGRAKWVRASARIAGHPAAPSPTKSDRRSACPVRGAGKLLYHGRK